MAIRADGTLWAWGNDLSGRTGLGAVTGNTTEPTRVGIDSWAFVSAGTHTVAIRADGSLWAWGNNANGRTGLGASVGNTPEPTRVGTDSDWERVSAGNTHTMAIRADGSLWAWGNNVNGKTGLGTATGSTLAPARVGTGNDWELVSAGNVHTAAIRAGGALWAWGINANGVTGLGTLAGNTSEPARVGDDNDWELVSAGDAHAAAIRAGGALWTWGSNQAGRTGLGAETGNTTAPTLVE